MPIEHIRLAHDKKYIVSSGHDNALRFWDVAYLYEEEQEEEEQEEKQEEKQPKQETQGSEEEDDDENDSDSRVEEKPRKKKQKTSSGLKNYQAQKNAAFFADM